MKDSEYDGIAITGIGVVSAIGQGKEAFGRALLDGRAAFDVMRRPGRQRDTHFLGAEIASLAMPGTVSSRSIRTASFSAQAALATLDEAWNDARLDDVDPLRVGLIVGGSNVQQRELASIHEAYAGREAYVPPHHALAFMDTDLCGLCTQQFGIKGLAYTIGGASASGQLAIVQAVQAVLSGQLDVAVALGAMTDLSHWECQAFRTLGAMGSDRYADAPELACRPFDRGHDGFIYGECCGAVVIERIASHPRDGVAPYARIAGFGVAMDANRQPDPSLQGEMRAIDAALRSAGMTAADIDYVNPHGTASVLGDETELGALRESGLRHAYLNATKSIVGHGLSAAGAVEVIATLVQMQAKRLHPTRNLDDPIDAAFNWVRRESVAHSIENALTLSMGFGGINTALCLTRYH